MRFRILFALGGPAPVGVHFYQKYAGATPTTAQLDLWAQAIDGVAVADLASLLSDGINFAEVEAADLSTSPSTIGTYSHVDAGTRAGLIPTIDTCLTTRWLIGRSYRGGKPKSFWPFGIVSDLASPNAWAAGLLSAFDTAWASFQTGIVGHVIGGTTLGVQVSVSYFQGLTERTKPSTGRKYYVGTPRPVPLVDTVIGVTPDIVIGSQRRRRIS